MNYSGRCAPPRVKPLLEEPFGDDLAAVPMLRGHYVLNLHRDLPTGTWRSLPMMGHRGIRMPRPDNFLDPDLSEVAVRRPPTARPARMLGASVTVG